VGTSPVLGRAAEIAWLRQAVVTRTTVGVHGPAGTGVSTLLAHLASADLDLEADLPWPVRRVLVHAGDADADAILREIELRLGRSPGPPGGEQVVVVLDDVRGGSAVLGRVLGALPRYTFLIGSQQPMLGPDRSLALAGLPQDAALYLLFSGVQRVLTPADHAGALRLAAALGGVPGELMRAAQAVRRGETTYARLAAGLRAPGPTGAPVRPVDRPHPRGGRRARRAAGAAVPLLLTTVLALAVLVVGVRLAGSRSQVDAAAAATPSSTGAPGTGSAPAVSATGPAAPVRPLPAPSGSVGRAVTPSATATASASPSGSGSAATSRPVDGTPPGAPVPPPEAPAGTFGASSPGPAGVLVVLGGQDAGQVRLGAGARTDVVLRNAGQGPLTVDSAQVASSPGGPFTVAASSCTELVPGADCTVTVDFAPDRLGAARATLEVGTLQGPPTWVRLAGTGFAELTVTVDGPAAGTPGAVSRVVSEDGELACTGRCVLRVRSPGQSVTVLRAVPGEGTVLERWSGDCSGTGERCELEMTRDRSVTAHLVPDGG